MYLEGIETESQPALVSRHQALDCEGLRGSRGRLGKGYEATTSVFCRAGAEHHDQTLGSMVFKTWT